MLTRARVVAGVTIAASLLLGGGATAAATPVPATDPAAVHPAADVVGGPALASTGVVVARGPGSTPLPTVAAAAWVLADLTTGEVLAAKGAHRRGRPASMLKTLTALTVMPMVPKDTVHKATYEEARADGGHVGIVPGATYTMWDLWHGLLLPSGNDAAAAIADANGGMPATVAAMQAEAAHLQARDTTVKNASGLDADGQLSSAYDMALIARAALDLEDFRTVTGALSYDFPGKPVSAGKKRPTYKIYTQNRLLLHGYDGAIGGKTGFTSLAHRTFWGAATRAGHTLVVTLLQIGEPTEAAARKLLDWGFANIGKVTAVGTLVGPVDPDAAAGGTPAPSQSAGAGGTGTTATTPTSSTKSLPWPVIAALGALLVAVVVAALWWRRRHGAAGATTAADESAPGAPPTGSGGSAATDVLPAAAAPRSVRTSSTGSSSVVVRAPGQSSTPRPGPARPVPATTGPPVAALDDTGPLPPVGGSSRPAGRTERPSVPAVELEQPQVGPERARPAPVPGGHVRVISPPSQGTPD